MINNIIGINIRGINMIRQSNKLVFIDKFDHFIIIREENEKVIIDIMDKNFREEIYKFKSSYHRHKITIQMKNEENSYTEESGKSTN